MAKLHNAVRPACIDFRGDDHSLLASTRSLNVTLILGCLSSVAIPAGGNAQPDLWWFGTS
jgi:hypothetical protein